MTTPASPPSGQERLPSGVTRLDEVLHGGFVRGGVHLLMGPPGAGKTILSNQICFHHVESGGKAIYLTLIAETHAAMLAHLSSFSFFRPDALGEALLYFSGYNELDQRGPAGLLEFIRQLLRDEHPSLLVLDGMATLEAHAGSELEIKRFVHQLQVLATGYGCTVFLVTHAYLEEHPHPEYTMVDGLVRLYYRLVGSRAIRELQILKLRGTDFVEGTHLYEITGDGVIVYPRLEALALPTPTTRERSAGRLALGVPQFDAMARGGIPTSSSTMLMGPPGSGKTIFGLHFLVTGARQGERGLYIGFAEPPVELEVKASQVNLELSEHLASGQIVLLWQAPGELTLDKTSLQILEAARTAGVRRVFLDGLEGLRGAAVYPERFLRMIAVLLEMLRSMDATVIFSAEVPAIIGMQLNAPIDPASAIAGNIILLRHVELRSQMYRLISILKMRQSGYDHAIREFRITDNGIEVANTSASAEAILSDTVPPVADAGSTS
jgi:circadian clock protein KaiC